MTQPTNTCRACGAIVAGGGYCPGWLAEQCRQRALALPPKAAPPSAATVAVAERINAQLGAPPRMASVTPLPFAVPVQALALDALPALPVCADCHQPGHRGGDPACNWSLATATPAVVADAIPTPATFCELCGASPADVRMAVFEGGARCFDVYGCKQRRAPQSTTTVHDEVVRLRAALKASDGSLARLAGTAAGYLSRVHSLPREALALPSMRAMSPLDWRNTERSAREAANATSRGEPVQHLEQALALLACDLRRLLLAASAGGDAQPVRGPDDDAAAASEDAHHEAQKREAPGSMTGEDSKAIAALRADIAARLDKLWRRKTLRKYRVVREDWLEDVRRDIRYIRALDGSLRGSP